MDASDESLVQLVYVSASLLPFLAADLTRLLMRARARNAKVGVTGMLLHDHGSFLQVLEGPENAVDQLFAKISLDPRHHRISKLCLIENTKRTFDGWSMGFADVSPRDLWLFTGCNDFFREARSYADVTPEFVRELVDALGAFKSDPLHMNVA